MGENVFHMVQLGRQSVVGTAVAATKLYPCDGFVLNLDRASQYPQEDRGRNARNPAARGYHGLRAADGSLSSDVRFEDIMHLLEMHFAGGITPTGAGPYTWVYPFEAGASTLNPYTIEEGTTDVAYDQYRGVGCLIDELTLEFDALAAPGAQPWRASASIVALDREASALTASLSAPSTLETILGHFTTISEGTVATAFASLSALSSSLIRYSQTTRRALVRRPYGGTSDIASAYGFGEMSNGTFEALVKVSTTTKTDLHDVWNSSGASLGERRIRVANTSGTKSLKVDARAGIFAVPVGERDGERIYQVTGEFADDSTLNAPNLVTVVNGVASLS